MNKKIPVNIRRNVAISNDPYIDPESTTKSECQICNAVFVGGRWYTHNQSLALKSSNNSTKQTTCPACRKLKDHVPGGVLKITGDFAASHIDDIMNLIRNESYRAEQDNPLERIMSLESSKNEIVIETTNEKLAQHLGKALHKAYSGNVDYKWAGDEKFARVTWHR